MFQLLPDFVSDLIQSISSSEPTPGLHVIPGSKPLTIEAAICPPLLYYIALLFLPPAPPPTIDTWAVSLLRNVIAALAGFLFFRLPLAYHVPQSIGLTYQLGLVGLYGGCRVLDAFFISRYYFNHIPRRIYYEHTLRPESPLLEGQEKEWSDGGQSDPFHGKGSSKNKTKPPNSNNTEPDTKTKENGHPTAPNNESIIDKSHAPDIKSYPANRRSSLLGPYFLVSRALSGPNPRPVYERAKSEDGWPHTFADRASWALELELSMRGVGFTWTTADVRHTRKTWLPTVSNRMHSILVHVLPVTLLSCAIIRQIYINHLANEPSLFAPRPSNGNSNSIEIFDANLTIPLQLLLTASLGAFLMSVFSLAHSLFAIALSPLAPSPLAFFPPLYTTRVWDLTSVRKFWSFGWHRLFARLFLVWGVWPGEWVERKLTGKSKDQPADVGKVLGGFLSSAFVHSFSVRGVLGGDWAAASGEAKFFALNGLAVVFEGGVQRSVKRVRKQLGWKQKMWYDPWIGRVWWIAVLLWTGRNFARGWVKSSLVREMAFM